MLRGEYRSPVEPKTIRRLWVLAESYHAIIYFAPEKVEAYKAAGLKGGWMGYFASRAAPMGAVGSEAVADAFYNFHPDMVARAIPDAWRYSSAEMVVRARYLAARAALERLIPAEAHPEVQAALHVARRALDAMSFEGRPLAAAWGALPWPEDPLLALWHACTVWREYRGDAHVAALRSKGLGPVEALLTHAAAGATSEEALRTNRGWSEDEWEAARRGLIERGLMDATGLTDKGRAVRDRVEQLTDRASAEPWAKVGEGDTAIFMDAMRVLVHHILRNGGSPFPNPMGLSRTEVDAALAEAGTS